MADVAPQQEGENQLSFNYELLQGSQFQDDVECLCIELELNSFPEALHLYCIVLYCIVLIVLYFTVLCYTTATLPYTILLGQCSSIPYYAMLCFTILIVY